MKDTTASLGEPHFGAIAFLRDLELRLGLSAPETPQLERRQAYATRLAALASHTHLANGSPPFYARSFALDPQATASTILAWRDSLIEAGWDRTRIPNCGPRVDALVAAELLPGDPLPMGFVDRLATVELALGETSSPPYESIVLLEEESAWSESWRRVLRSLELLGTRLERPPRPAPPPRGKTDLADAQRWVLGHGDRAPSCSWKGDGSLLFLSARTSWELAEAVVGLVRAHASQRATIVRLGDAAPLEAAFERQGLLAKGGRRRARSGAPCRSCSSRWRCSSPLAIRTAPSSS
ncbi:MAG: hypothetical protein U0414_40370 [Polyangiaceae bacterium]